MNLSYPLDLVHKLYDHNPVIGVIYALILFIIVSEAVFGVVAWFILFLEMLMAYLSNNKNRIQEWKDGVNDAFTQDPYTKRLVISAFVFMPFIIFPVALNVYFANKLAEKIKQSWLPGIKTMLKDAKQFINF